MVGGLPAEAALLGHQLASCAAAQPWPYLGLSVSADGVGVGVGVGVGSPCWLSVRAGLLFPGFMYLHTLFLTRGRLESTWTVLKLFGKSAAGDAGCRFNVLLLQLASDLLLQPAVSK